MRSKQWKKVLANSLILTMLFSFAPFGALNEIGLGEHTAEAATVAWTGGDLGDITVSQNTNFNLAADTTTLVNHMVLANNASVTFKGEGTAVIQTITTQDGTTGTNGSSGQGSYGGASGATAVTIESGNIEIDAITSGTGGKGGVGGEGTRGTESTGGYGGKGGNSYGGASGAVTVNIQAGNVEIDTITSGTGGAGGYGGYGGSNGLSGATGGTGGNSYGGTSGAVTVHVQSGNVKINTITSGTSGYGGKGGTGGALSGSGGSAQSGNCGSVNVTAPAADTVQIDRISSGSLGKNGQAGEGSTYAGSVGSAGHTSSGSLGNVTISLSRDDAIRFDEIIRGNTVTLNLVSMTDIFLAGISAQKLVIDVDTPRKTTLGSTNTTDNVLKIKNGYFNVPALEGITTLDLQNGFLASNIANLTTVTSNNKVIWLKPATAIPANTKLQMTDKLGNEIYSRTSDGVINHIIAYIPNHQIVKFITPTKVLVNQANNLGTFQATESADYNSATETFNVIQTDIKHVTFHANGGTLSGSTKQGWFVGAKILEPDEPVKGGYVFKGWYQNAEETGSAWNFSSDTLSSDLTLYAKWIPGPPTFTKVWLTPEGWTKDLVTLNIQASATEGELKYSFDAGMNWQIESSKTFATNIQLAANSVQIKDNAGNIVGYPASLSIANIDNTAPNIVTVNKSTENQVSSVEVLVSAFDLQSGIASYSFDGGVSWQPENYKTYDELTTLETSTIQVKDVAGNIAKYPSKVTIDNITDTAAPEINEVIISPDEWTNEDITILISATDNVKIAGYSFDGGGDWQTTNFKKYNDNQTILADMIQVKDTSGNISKYGEDLLIAQIDREAPTAPTLEQVSQGEYSVMPGVDTLSGTKTTQYLKYIFNHSPGEWIDWDGSNVNLPGNEILMARSIDYAGNISNQTTVFGHEITLPSYNGNDIASNEPVDVPVDIELEDYQYSYQVVEHKQPLTESWNTLKQEENIISIAEEGIFDTYIKIEDDTATVEVISDPFKVLVDMTPPTAPTINLETEAVEENITKAVLTINGGIDELSGVKTTAVLINDEEAVPDPIETPVMLFSNLPSDVYEFEIPTTYTLSEPGTYTVTTYTVDNVDNQSEVVTQTITIAQIDHTDEENPDADGDGAENEPDNGNQTNGSNDNTDQNDTDDENSNNSNTNTEYVATGHTGTAAGGKDSNGRPFILQEYVTLVLVYKYGHEKLNAL